MNISELHRRYFESNAVSTDTRNIKENDIFFALKGENFDANTYVDEAIAKGAKYVVIDDKKFYRDEKQYILVENVLETLQKLANFHRNFLQVPILALTGSNGKTTTKELIYAVLSQKYYLKATKGNLNNHIGVPLTILSMNRNTEIGIVEMGTNHFGEIKNLCEIAEPDFGYITNFGKAHLESFKNIDGVVKAKSELYNYLIENEKKAFVNLWDERQVELTKELVTIAVKPIEVFNTPEPQLSFIFNDEVVKTQLVGDFNVNNIAAAIAIGQFFEVPNEDIIQAIKKYKPENKRSQYIEKKHVKIVLDAYNANPTSMQAALQTFANDDTENKIPVLGDMYELGDTAQEEHQNIVELVKDLGFKSSVFIGQQFATTKHDNLKVYKNFEDFKNQFNVEEYKNKTLLIKASRGMALERVVDLFD